MYAVYDPVSRRCVMARAGHPPPAVLSTDGKVSFVELPDGPPLGLGGVTFESTEVELADGDLLVLYTDGLVRSQERDLGTGLDLLRETLTASAEDVCHPGRPPPSGARQSATGASPSPCGSSVTATDLRGVRRQ